MKLIKLIVLAAMVATVYGSPASAEGFDLFDTVVLEDGTLLIQHLNSYHNCCIYITHEVEIVDFTIFIKEVEPILYGCWCYCYFDVDLEISDLPPGAYSIEYTYDVNENIYDEVWVTETLSAVVPDLGHALEDPGFLTSLSDCHDGVSVGVQEVKFDQLKAYYR
ncbi:MAG: hypothetical protein KOO60_01765 [Gemmatimonadales bacterium]|nr:hypothetical protein [Gemmatimonadales bacterium]